MTDRPGPAVEQAGPTVEQHDPAGQNDPASSQDPVAAFAAELRRLRAGASDPSFRQMARWVHFSSSTLADATQGRRLPSEAVVMAFAKACGADPVEWSARLAAAVRDRDAAATRPATPVAPPAERRTRTTRLVVLLCGVFAVGVGAGMTALHLSGWDTATPPAPKLGPPADGADPGAAGCAADARIQARSALEVGGRQVGVLELRYSPHCRGGWARFVLQAGAQPAVAEVRVEATDGRAAAYAQLAAADLPLYTDLLHENDGCLRAIVAVHLANQIPTAMTGCLAASAP